MDQIVEIGASLEKQTRLPEIQRRAVKQFGLATNPQEARYILSDGSLLKMTEGNYREHGGILKIFPNETSIDKAILKFMNTGAIRFGRRGDDRSQQAYAEFTYVPNEAQVTSLIDNSFGVDRLALEMKDPKGNVLLDEYFELTPRASQVRAFINRAKSLQAIVNSKAA